MMNIIEYSLSFLKKLKFKSINIHSLLCSFLLKTSNMMKPKKTKDKIGKKLCNEFLY
jgi:hypothetical protein